MKIKLEDEKLINFILKEARDVAFQAAQRGDTAELRSKVMTGDDLTAKERKYIISLLKKADKTSSEKYQREIEIASKKALAEPFEVGEYEAFIQSMMDEYNLSRAQIFRDVKASEKNLNAITWVKYIKYTNKL